MDQLTDPVAVTRGRGVQLDHPRRQRHKGTQGLSAALVDCALYCDGVRSPQQLALEEAHEKAQESDSGFVWVGLHEPSEAAFEAVSREFDLHPLAVEDAVHAHQRPKLETYGDTLFMVLKTVRYVDTSEVIETGEVMVFLGPSFLVTVRHGTAGALGEVRTMLEAMPQVLALGPVAVLWGVADAIVDGYLPAIEGVEADIEEVEDEVFSPVRRGNPTQRIYGLKREVLDFSRAVVPLAEATGRLAAGELGLHPQALPWFRDVHDHVLRASDAVQGMDALLQSTMDANVAQVSLRQNEDMRKISAYAAILTLCTTVAGIYGMNFEHMPELGWALGYPFALLLMVGGSAVLYRAFRRNGWL